MVKTTCGFSSSPRALCTGTGGRHTGPAGRPCGGGGGRSRRRDGRRYRHRAGAGRPCDGGSSSSSSSSNSSSRGRAPRHPAARRGAPDAGTRDGGGREGRPLLHRARAPACRPSAARQPPLPPRQCPPGIRMECAGQWGGVPLERMAQRPPQHLQRMPGGGQGARDRARRPRRGRQFNAQKPRGGMEAARRPGCGRAAHRPCEARRA